MTSLAIILHQYRQEVPSLANDAIAWCESNGVTPVLPSGDANDIGQPSYGGTLAAIGAADACLSLGGDGTILRAVRNLGSSEVPIIGVNAGRMGYLTEFSPDQLVAALDSWAANELQIETRMMLAYEVQESGLSGFALNEIVVERAESGHTVSVDTKINGNPFTTILADGLIISTPTGSTAYSLSAGGPIVEPTTQAILLTPVAAHMMFNRTMVLGATSTVELTVAGYRAANLTVDGRSVAVVEPGQSVACQVSSLTAKFLVTGKRDFQSILKEKFGLTDR